MAGDYFKNVPSIRPPITQASPGGRSLRIRDLFVVARTKDAALDVLRELSTRDDYDQNAPLPFNGYGWSGFARQQLAHVWKEPVEVG